MNTVDIKTGLRKLEFTARNEHEPQESNDAALVEFVRTTRLAANQLVRVTLGRREGVLRELVGHAYLTKAVSLGRGKTEYHYRLEGPIVTWYA
jgi:hypothetical protein